MPAFGSMTRVAAGHAQRSDYITQFQDAQTITGMSSVVHRIRQEPRISSCLIGFGIQLGDMTNMQLPLNLELFMRDTASCTPKEAADNRLLRNANTLQL